jgi:hypothetical protein
MKINYQNKKELKDLDDIKKEMFAHQSLVIL